MSADLFAEFGSNAQPPPLPQPSSSNASSKQPASSKAPFDFGFNSSLSAATTTASPVEQWPSLDTRPSGVSGWGAVGPSIPQAAHATQASNDDDDGWGDFETAEPTKPPASNALSSQFGGLATAPRKEPEPKNRPVRAPTIDIMTNTLVDVRHRPETRMEPRGASSRNPSLRRIKPRIKSAPSNSNVLFDVDDFELQGGEEGDDDDEFGDFEMVTPAPAQPKAEHVPAPVPAASSPQPLLDLLSLNDSSQQRPEAVNANAVSQRRPPPQHLGALSFGATTSNLSNPPKSPSFQQRNPFPDLEIKTMTAAVAAAKRQDDEPKSASPMTAWPTIERATNSAGGWKDDYDDEEDGDWGAWDDIPSKSGNIKSDVDSAKPPPDDWDWDAGGNSGPAAAQVSDNDPPPINVPPPSAILSMFPDLLNSGSSLFKPISGQNASIKQQILSNPKAVQFLQGYILLATTAARVIAGRKHRWHRDKILAKSMSISAAGSKGMKLAGVDKTQSAREDREAADVAAAWREHVGRLRSAVAAANAAGKANLKVPELGENMLVQTAKMVPTAPKACIICGLKREERISKVDYDVEDSFGEWWVEHWGHRSCKNFWIEHEYKLRQR